jgi:hypothetical protein
VFNGGVYYNDMQISSEAMVDGKIGIRHLPDNLDRFPDGIQPLSGSWLYGGFHYRQFGHSLTESVGRLWALEKFRHPVKGLIFNCFTGGSRRPQDPEESKWLEKTADIARRQSLFTNILRLFGADLPVHFVSKPIRVESLVVPAQLMGLLPYSDLMGGHPTYTEHVRRCVNRIVSEPSPKAAKRLYISRSKFKKAGIAGSFFLEDILDINFAAAGYDIVYPELLSLNEQISLYSSASHIVMVAGTACHVAALAMNGNQKVTVLTRFYGQGDQFTSQLRLMGASEVLSFNCISGTFTPASQADRESLKIHPSKAHYAIDFTKLWSFLRESDFVQASLADDGSSDFATRSHLLCEELACQYGVDAFTFLPRGQG